MPLLTSHLNPILLPFLASPPTEHCLPQLLLLAITVKTTQQLCHSAGVTQIYVYAVFVCSNHRYMHLSTSYCVIIWGFMCHFYFMHDGSVTFPYPVHVGVQEGSRKLAQHNEVRTNTSVQLLCTTNVSMCTVFSPPRSTVFGVAAAWSYTLHLQH